MYARPGTSSRYIQRSRHMRARRVPVRGTRAARPAAAVRPTAISALVLLDRRLQLLADLVAPLAPPGLHHVVERAHRAAAGDHADHPVLDRLVERRGPFERGGREESDRRVVDPDLVVVVVCLVEEPGPRLLLGVAERLAGGGVADVGGRQQTEQVADVGGAL